MGCGRNWRTQRSHIDNRSINVDGRGDLRFLLDASGDSATAIHALPPRKHLRDEDIDDVRNKRSRVMTQLAEDDSSNEDPTPITRGSSASRLALQEPWATKAKEVEDKANDLERKGATMICLTCTGTELALKSFKPLLIGHGELDCKIVDACLSMLIRPVDRVDRLEARQKVVLFESTF
ncbi:MAG: hypothetical protein M1813_000160 [Trichoglossum hirsutum]|jgi:hypothetical protein|nr:MAG: hypothetical protein M1813_000160 [Trichoglossum hirsutum]